MYYQIAIDGPSSCGKSTCAKILSKELSFIYVDTGAMYRAVCLYYLRNNIPCDSEEKVSSMLSCVDVSIDYNQNVYLNGENVTDFIRSQEVNQNVYKISSYKLVREKLVELQKELAKNNNVIMDGRDICTVVLPNAFLKIYMTADSDVRAMRRYKELIADNQNVTYEQVKKSLEERDYLDTHREVTPMYKTEDSIEIDSSNMTIEEVANKIKEIYLEKRGI